MKTTKLTRIFVLILSLALLIGSAVCVAASADEGDYAIKSINIAHGDQIKVLIAVDAPAEEAENITVSYVFGGNTYEATYWQNMDIYEDGVLYPVFYTIGIPAKDIGEAITAKVGNGAEKSLSVADYLYTKLAKEGYAFATEAEDVARKNLYLNLLDYGAQAQEVLWNNKYPDAQRPLVNSVTPVYLEDGVSIGGKTGLVTIGDLGRVTPGFVGAGHVLGYRITDADGVRIVNNSTVYLTGISKIAPIYVVEGAAAFDFSESYTDVMVDAKPDGDGNPTQVNQITFESGYTVSYSGGSGSNYGGAYAKVLEESGNKYLRIVAPGRNTNKEAVNYNERSHGTPKSVPVKVTEDANVVVYSFDMRSNTVGAGNLQFIFHYNGTSKYIQFSTLTSKPGNTLDGINFLPNEGWNNIRIEFYEQQHVFQVYINGVYRGNLVTFSGSPASLADVTNITDMNLALYNGSAAIDYDIDNIACYATTKTYVEVPTVDYTVETFDQDWAYGTFSGAGTVETNQEVMAANGLFYAKMDGSSRTNAGKTYSEIVTENGNNYLHSYSPGRDGVSTNRAHCYYLTPEYLTAASKVNTTVFEADIKIDSLCSDIEGMTFIFYAADGKALSYQVNTECTFYKAGLKFANAGEWSNVRFVFNYSSQLIELYLNDEFVGNLTSDNASSAGVNADWSNFAGGVSSLTIFTYNGGGAVEVSFDNVAFYSTYVAK